MICARARAQAGFALIEVVVSAGLLVVAAAGLYTGIDGATATSGANQAKTVAASLGQADQDRMRSMKVAALSNYQSTRTQTVGSATYTIASRTDWITDSSGSVSCANSSTQASYLELTSTVTSQAIGSAHPVTLQSLLTPAPGVLNGSNGSLAAQIIDQAGNPVAGVTVSISGPSSSTLTTNSAGCAYFGYLTPGNYSGTYTMPGYVDQHGHSTGTLTGSATAGTTTLVTGQYAPAVAIPVNFVTQAPGSSTQIAAPGTAVTWVTSGGGGQSQAATVQTPATSMSVGGLSPFQSGYTLYAGRCSFDDPGASNRTTASPTPTSSPPVNVVEPMLDVTVRRNGAIPPTAHTKVTSTQSGCTDVYAPPTVISSNDEFQYALPYGSYSVCADDGTNKIVKTLTDTNALGTAATLDTTSTGWQAGQC